jgi:hypothetical protein
VGTKDDEYAKREIENTPNYSYLKRAKVEISNRERKSMKSKQQKGPQMLEFNPTHNSQVTRTSHISSPSEHINKAY